MTAHIATGITIAAMLVTFIFTTQTFLLVAKTKRTGRGKYYRVSSLDAGECFVFDDLNHILEKNNQSGLQRRSSVRTFKDLDETRKAQ